MAAEQAFTWGFGGQKITTPEQAKRVREVAEALNKRAPSENWTQGLAGIAGALSSNVLNDRAATAETEGQQRAGGLFANLATNTDPNNIIAALTSPDAAWATPGQSQIASALLNQGLQRSDPAYQLDIDLKRQQLADAQSGGTTEYFGSTLPWKDAQGNLQYYQLRKGEGLPQLPEGSQWLEPTSTVNTGTAQTVMGRTTGEVLGSVPIENETAAFDTATGTGLGKANADNIVTAESVTSKMPGLRTVIDNLTSLADTATYTQSGQAMDAVKRELGLPVGQGAIDRTTYTAIVDNQVLPLLRDTFGAAFTEREGQTLRDTLGDPNKSPPEKKAILDAFISQKERDVAGMQSRIGEVAPVEQGAPAPTIRVWNPQTRRLE